MSDTFTSWQERPERLLPSLSRSGISSFNKDTLQDPSVTPHPAEKWIQEQGRINSNAARMDELDQFGIPIHPSHSRSSRLAAQAPSPRNGDSAALLNAASSSTSKPSSSSRHLLSASSASNDHHKSTAYGSPSPSWQLLSADPSPSASRIVQQPEEAEEDENVGLLLGQSKRRRRKDSYSSFGSSVLPAPLYASGARYNAHGINNGLAASRQAIPAKQGRSTYPPSNHSGAAPASRRLAPSNDAFAHHQPQLDTQCSRQRHQSSAMTSRPSGFDLDDWLRTSQAPPGLRTSPSLGTLTTFDRPERRSAALSEAGRRRRRPQGGSTSGLSAGVLSAGPESPWSCRKASASASGRESSGYSSLSPNYPAFMASQELSREAESRTMDTIEEWRAKADPQASASTIESALSAAQQQHPITGDLPESATRRRRKSSVKGSSHPVSMDGPAPPLPSIPAVFTAGSVTSKSGRRRRKKTETSLAGLLSPDRASIVHDKSATTATPALPTPPPGLRDLYALSGLGSQADTPVRRLIRWLAKEQLKSVILPLVLLTAFLVRWMVATGDWSGRGVEPMHGDFEAQRHWIELTLHLPTSKWYIYNLQYWGLDYPPLTAWVSLACGYASQLFPSTKAGFAFETSRGNEDAATVTFMRATVVVGDLLVYLPALALFITRKLEGRGKCTQAIALFSILLQPALILIDHGHFQYNSIMLGFSAACFALLHTTLPNPDASSSPFARNRNQAVADLSCRLSYEYVAAAIFLCLSLSFKQMALYYAPAVFALMLGRCIGLACIDPERGLTLFVGLGLAVVITFGVLFAPWLTSLEQIGQLVHRIFPLARGLFEDKVANVWCFLSVLPLPARFKLKNLMPATALARLSLLVTLVAILPGCCLLFWVSSQTAKMEMMVAQETVQKRTTSTTADKSTAFSAAGSVKAPTLAASLKSTNTCDHRAPSVIGSAAGAPARSEIESLLAGSVSKSISGRISRVGPPTETLDRHNLISHDSDYHLSASDSRPVASSLPSPAAQMLPYGLTSVSCAFFLFGFQTHEKSILLPLLPLTLILGAKGDTWGGNITSARDWEWTVWFNNIATFSLFPLLKKDGQALQYVVLLVGWNWFVGNLAVPFQPLNSIKGLVKSASFFRKLSTLTYLAAAGLHVVELVVPMLLPGLQAKLWARYPDIYPVLNVLLTTPCFMVVFIWALIRQVQVAFANGLDLSLSSKSKTAAKSTKPS
ncbi:hypothetical protein NDA13_004355 [Ustilago tritici]|nr:hypothetical protein NDA13_004355 [Ustilago tritici]